jgi:hypothetical protein
VREFAAQYTHSAENSQHGHHHASLTGMEVLQRMPGFSSGKPIFSTAVFFFL